MNIVLIVLGHLFTFVAAIAGLLLGISFSRGQRERFPVLRKLDGKQIHFAVTALLSLALVFVTNVSKDVKKEFETVQGPQGQVIQKATASGFERELEDAADELKASAKSYFDAAEKDFKTGSYEHAARNYQKSIDLLPTMSAYANAGLSWSYSLNYPEAEKALFAGLRLARKKRNEAFEGWFFGSIGVMYFAQNKQAEALEAYKQSLEIFKRIGFPLGEAYGLSRVGNVYRTQGKLKEALNAYQQSFEIHKRMDDPLGEASDLGDIGDVYRTQDKLKEALNAYQQSLEIHKRMGVPLGEASDLGDIGDVYRTQDKLKEALNAYQQSLEIYKRIGNRLGEAKNLGHIADLYYEQGQFEEALRLYSQAQDIFEQIEAAPGIELSIVQSNIAIIKSKWLRMSLQCEKDSLIKRRESLQCEKDSLIKRRESLQCKKDSLIKQLESLKTKVRL